VEPFYIVYYGLTDDPAEATRSSAVPARVGTSELIQVIITGLENETVYYVWVETVFGDLGRAALTSVVDGMPIPPASVPVNIAVTPGPGLLLVNWDTSPRAASYTVAYSDEGGETPPSDARRVTVYSNAALLTGLSNGIPYSVWVMSSNSAADSRYSEEFPGTPTAASAAPEAPAIKTIEERNKRLTVVWDALPTATSYEVHWTNVSTSGSDTVTPVAGTAELSYMIPNLLNSIPYDIHIVAKNPMGSSGDSLVVIGTPFAKPPLDYTAFDFVIATATAEFINAQSSPPSPLLPNGLNNKDRLTRVKETAIGNLFTDGLAWFVRDRYPEENIDFVFLNGGYMDGGMLPQGEITLGRFLSVVRGDPSRNTLTIISLRGSDVKELYAYAATRAHYVSQTGGGSGGTGAWGNSSKEIRYQITYPAVDMSIPGPNWDEAAGKYKTLADPEPYYRGVLEPGTLKFNGADIDDNRIYRIATPNYIADAGDGYYVFLQKGLNRRDIPLRVYYGVAEYIYDQGTITPYLDGRLVIYGGVPMGGQEPHPPYRN
jgi:hypothetical protein